MKLKKILEDVAQKDESARIALSEIKMARVNKHFRSSEYPVGIITAFRDGIPYEQNKRRNQTVALELRKSGYGYVYVDGAWKETTDDGSVVEVKEDSILVIGNTNDNGKLHRILLEKSKEYNQDAFLFKPKGGTDIYLIYQSGKREKLSNNFRLDKFEDGYTKLRGRGKGKVFSFHEERETGGWFGRRIKYERMKKLEEYLNQNNKI